MPAININPTTALYIRDKRTGRMSVLSKTELLVIPNKGFSLEDVEKELQERLLLCGLSGIPIRKLSEVDSTVKKTGQPVKAKPKKAHFKLRSQVTKRMPFSQNWEATSEEIKDTDVFVDLLNFKAFIDSESIYSVMIRDKELIEFLDGNFPTIYGVKTSPTIGIPYHEWRKTYINQLVTQSSTFKNLVDVFYWGLVCDKWNITQGLIKEWAQFLPKTHPILQFLCTAKKEHLLLSWSNRLILRSYSDYWHPANVAADAEAALLKRYPFLHPDFCAKGFHIVFNSERRDSLLEYIQLMDQK
jgi:hypothetical protein